jgi:hypothetical protein
VAPLALLLPLTFFALALGRDRELLTKGSLAVGRVIGTTNSGRQYSRLCYYDFADAISEVRRGSSWVQKYSAEGIKVGSDVHVFYLPEDAERNSRISRCFREFGDSTPFKLYQYRLFTGLADKR